MPNFNIDDNSIIERLRKSDESALIELYNDYWQPLFVSSYNVLKNRELSEDIIQEIFLSLWKNREKLKINVSLKSYLYACVRYQMFIQFRKNEGKVRVELFEGIDQRCQEDSPESELIYKELVEQINFIIDALPEKCREVFKLSREEQLSHKDISNRLEISTKTVENHMTKALRILRTSMGSMICINIVLWFLFK